MSDHLESVAQLGGLVRQHRVYWRVSTLTEPMSGAHLRPALRIELRGSPYRPEHAPIPGCPECQKVHRRLILIAQAVIPEDLGDWEVRMEPFDGVLTLMPGRGRLDVTLTLSLLPRGPWQDSHPESVACLREIESKLELLGAFKSH